MGIIKYIRWINQYENAIKDQELITNTNQTLTEMIMRDFTMHQAQQMGELPGGGLFAQLWRNVARRLESSFHWSR
jgi:hypothetical protein